MSSIPRATTFNDRIQADTLWVTIPGRAKAVPVLMISDVTTGLVTGRVLMTESSEEFIKAVERGWIKHFPWINIEPGAVKQSEIGVLSSEWSS